MTVLAWVVVAIFAAPFVVVGWWLVPPRGFRRPRALSPDHCRVCDRQLEHGKTWETREHLAPTPGMPDFGGGTFLAITYCRRHRPPGAVRA